jgi:dihydrofolate reductase
MGIVVAHMSMSLDGFIAGPDVSIAHPMGVGGERLHEWLFAPDRDAADSQTAGEMFSHETTGAVLMGNTTFTVGEAPWGDDGAFGMPCFVVTRHARPMLRKQETTFTFVTSGLADAFEQARRAAAGKNVNVMGANTIQQVLAAGAVDELHINLIAVALGSGVSLFAPGSHYEFDRTRTIESSAATHIRLRVRKS